MYQTGKTCLTKLQNDAWLMLIPFVLLPIIWLHFSISEPLGPPDFYLYYNEGARLLELDFKAMFVPPAFPLTLHLLSHIFSFFFDLDIAPLWAGRTINLIFCMLSVTLLLKLSRSEFSTGAGFFVSFICLSHIYLKHLSTPLTEMMFFAFVLGFFNSLNQKKWKLMSLWALFATATRFEGILLVFIAIGVTFPLLKRRYNTPFLLAISTTSIALTITPFLFLFSARLQDHFERIIRPDGVLYFILNPGHLLDIIFGNIFFFLPPHAPLHFKLIALCVTGALFSAGIYVTFKRNRPFALGALFFVTAFFMAKGYISNSDRFFLDTRRTMYPIIIILVISFWGAQYLYKIALRRKKLHFVWISILSSLVFLSFHIPEIGDHIGYWSLVALIPFAMHLYQKKTLKTCLTKPFVFSGIIFFLGILAHMSFWMGFDYINSSPNKGALAIARYINARPESKPALFITARPTLLYYLTDKNLIWNGTWPEADYADGAFQSEEEFMGVLQDLIRNNSISYIAFDFYLSYPSSITTFIKTTLMRNAGNTDLFLVKNLHYKGQLVAYILRPRNRSTLPNPHF